MTAIKFIQKSVQYPHLKVKFIYEIIGDLQCMFQHNSSTTDKTLFHSPDTAEKWEYIETVHQLFIDDKQT
jgi:hypothetical protein